jgi:hypothetical protein
MRRLPAIEQDAHATFVKEHVTFFRSLHLKEGSGRSAAFHEAKTCRCGYQSQKTGDCYGIKTKTKDKTKARHCIQHANVQLLQHGKTILSPQSHSV